jgi:hypothetical protein
MKPQKFEDRKAHFIQRGTLLHKGKFDYSFIEYKTAKTKVLIVCPDHGNFYQSPDKHLSPNSKGCPQCWELIRTKNNNNRKGLPSPKPKPLISTDTLLLRCIEKYGDKFNYHFEDYKGMHVKCMRIICPIHGQFITSMANFLSKQTISGCPECGKLRSITKMTRSYDYIVNQFNNKFNFLYEYPDYNSKTYKNKKSLIDIICNKHGLFKKKAQNHLSGQGCFQCSVDDLIRDNILVGGYSEKLFKEKPELKDVPAYLYYLTINDGELFKIGISRVSVMNRINAIKSKSKGEILQVNQTLVMSSTLYECYLLEQKILSDFASLRIFKPWSTELFQVNIENDIKKYFKIH